MLNSEWRQFGGHRIDLRSDYGTLGRWCLARGGTKVFRRAGWLPIILTPPWGRPETTKVISRNLSRRLERLECLVPTSGPLVIEVRIISAADGLIVDRIRSTWDDDPNGLILATMLLVVSSFFSF